MFVNEYISDELIRRQVYLERFKVNQAKEFDRIINVISKVFKELLIEFDVERISDLTKAQLRKFINALLENVRPDIVEWMANQRDMLYEIGVNENEFLFALISETIDTPITALTESVVQQTVDNTPNMAIGAAIAEALRQWYLAFKREIRKTVHQGYAAALSLADFRRSFLGSKNLKFKNGLLEKFKRGTRSLIHTLIQHAASVVRFKAMKRWALSYVWVSVLDFRTSAVCRSLDGLIFAMGKGPIPPAHYSCRSHIEMLWERNIKFLKGRTVQVREREIKYYDWLKKQKAAFQDEVLGKERGKIFRSGQVSPDEFAKLQLNKYFEPITLAELKGLIGVKT